MTAEKLLDAMNYLPEELLEQTDRLRQKSPIRWQHWTALAACLCLVLGIAWAFVFPGAKSANDGAAPEYALRDEIGGGSSTQESGSTSFVRATVAAAEADQLTVTLADGSQVKVLLTEIENIPALEPGQEVRLYLNDIIQTDSKTLTPYKIEIEEDGT